MKRVILLALGFATWSSAAGAAMADSHTLFLNDCMPSSCDVHAGTTNATTSTSDIPSRASTVQAFNLGATAWADLLSCVRGVMSPYDLNVTDQRPASGNYFEVMVAGTSSDLGLATDTLAIGDTACQGVGDCVPFQSNALAFAFANDSYFASRPNDLCADVLQALAGTFALDHVVDASDVMSYNAYSGVRAFHDGEACGSDCMDGMSPFGSTCSGSGGDATHVCVGTGTATQDEVQTLLALFGPAQATGGGGEGGASEGGAGEGGANTAGEASTEGGRAGEGGQSGSADQGQSGNAERGGQGGRSGGGTAGKQGTQSGGRAGASAANAAGKGGMAGSDEGSGNAPGKSSSGCGCRVAPERDPEVAFLLGPLAIMVLVRRRSRERRRA